MDSPKRFLEVILDLPLGRSFHYTAPDEGPYCGRRVRVPFAGRRLTGFVTGETGEPPALPDPTIRLKPIERLLDKEAVFDDTILATARWIADFYFAAPGQALAAMLPGAFRPRSLDGFGGAAAVPVPAPLLALGVEQEAAVAAIRAGLARKNGARFLLHGITGSGKTEVYRHAAREAIAAGMAVIVLVPEIALTPQTIARFQSLLPDRIAVLHSRLTPAERLGQWQRIRNGGADLAIGARSAVFAPFTRPLLIIIDEEHESSYKAGDCPRYHARQVAFYRTAPDGCLLLGSATPSLESLHHAREGRLEALHLTTRFAAHARPRINLVDMTQAPPGAVIAPELTAAVAAAVKDGNQGILFLNRRGFAPSLLCRDCNETIRCPHCSISLSLHRERGALVCHYCGHTIRFESACPQCHGTRIRISGSGTERAEDFLARRLPTLRIARLDSDSTAERGSLATLLEEFAAHRHDVLVGTQMVTKGLDFPDVTVIGVLSCDNDLSLPDFRSYERVHNQLLQVVGRCGRAEKPGVAYLQTSLPEEDPIRSVLTGDSAGFIDRELARRREADYPPFTRIIRLVFRGPREENVRKAAAETAALLAPRLPAGARLLGPAPCPLARIARNHRCHLLLLAPLPGPLRALLRGAGLHEGSRGDVYLEIDVDPLSML